MTPLLRSGKTVLTIALAQSIWGVSHEKARDLLGILNQKGWIKRIKAGVYIPVPLEADPNYWGTEDPWTLGKELFSPCYIGGWDAANYWGFTDQLFQKTWIYTSQPVSKKNVSFGGTEYMLTHISEKNLFGTKDIRRNNATIPLSDPTRTILDLVEFMEEFGGISAVVEVFEVYLKSPYKNVSLILEYGRQKGNKTVFKKIGFLLDLLGALSKNEYEQFQGELSAGYSQICSKQPGQRIVTKWRLKMPKSWKNRYDSKI